MVHTAHHTLPSNLPAAGIIEKSFLSHNYLQKLKFKLAKTNYTHYTSSYTETQQTRAFSDHFALWKCGKRLLADGKQIFTARWKSRLSHSSASMTVYAHSTAPTTANILPILSYPILIEREKENKKEAGASPSVKPKAALPLCYGKVFKIAAYTPQIGGADPHGNHKGSSRKSRHRRFSAPFQPLSAHFFERADW